MATRGFHVVADSQFSTAHLVHRKDLPNRHPDVREENYLERNAALGISKMMLS
jgi:hypothetical protein